MKAEFEVQGQTVEIDTSEMEQRISEEIGGKLKEYFKQLKTWQEKQPVHGGKGVVEAYMPTEKKAAVVEEFQKGERCNPQKIKEQWTIAVPKFAQYELAGHLRDYVWVTDVVKGN